MRYWDGAREEGSFRGDGNSRPRGPRPAGEGRANLMIRVDTQEGMNVLAKEYGSRIIIILCDNPVVRIPSELMECTIIRDRTRWETIMRDRHYLLVQEAEIRKTWFVFTGKRSEYAQALEDNAMRAAKPSL